jgi:hypothetical protein
LRCDHETITAGRDPAGPYPVKFTLTRSFGTASRNIPGEAGKKSRGMLHPNWGEVKSNPIAGE